MADDDDDDDAAPEEHVEAPTPKLGMPLLVPKGESGSVLFHAESAQIAGGEVSLLIKDEDGREVPFTCPVDVTVLDVKAEAKKLFDVGDDTAPSALELLLDDAVMMDPMSLRDYSTIKANSTVVIVMKRK